MTAIELLALLVFAHYVADYPMQGKFIAFGKSRSDPIPGVPWYQILTAHAVMHGGLVGGAVVAAGLTGSNGLLSLALPIAAAESVCHWLIDDWKCRFEASMKVVFSGEELERRRASAYNIDQALHVICKIAWVATCVAMAGIPILHR